MSDDRRMTAEHESPTGDPEAWLRASWATFLQPDCAPYDREDKGLQAVFRSVFPVKGSDERGELVFVSYALGEPSCGEADARRQGRTLVAGLKVTLQLMTYETRDDGERMVRDIKEQEVFFGELPVPTAHGTLIVDGHDCLLRPVRTPVVGPSRTDDGLVVHGLDGDTLHLRRRPDGFEASLSLAEASWPELVDPSEKGRALRLDATGVSLVIEGPAPSRVFVAPRDLTPDEGPGVPKRAQLTGKRFAAMQGGVFPLSGRDATRFTLLDAVAGADGVAVAPAGMALSPALVRALVAAGVSQVRARLRDERPRQVTASGLADAEAVARWYGSTLNGCLALGEPGRARLAEVIGWGDTASDDVVLLTSDVHALAQALETGAALPDLTTTTLGPGERLARLYQGPLQRIATEAAVLIDMHSGYREEGDLDVLMPHELVNARPASDALDRLLSDRKDCEPVEPARIAERVREAW